MNTNNKNKHRKHKWSSKARKEHSARMKKLWADKEATLRTPQPPQQNIRHLLQTMKGVIAAIERMLGTQ
jgi:hypothetical protein